MSKIDGLLAVLDMSEVKLCSWLKKYGYDNCVISYPRMAYEDDDGMDWKLNKAAFANLAFQLRGEAVGYKVVGIVPEYFQPEIKSPPFPKSLYYWFKAKYFIDEYLHTYRYPGNRDAWWLEQSQSVHWIVCYHISKELEKISY